MSDYEDIDWTVCAEREGSPYNPFDGMFYYWSGLPKRSFFNDEADKYVVSFLLPAAVVGIYLNLKCATTIHSNKQLTRTVRTYLQFENVARICISLEQLYHAYCVFSWQCVDVTNYPFCGFFLNQIVTAVCTSMLDATQMLILGFAVNRFYAVYFNGKLYQNGELFFKVYAVIALSWTVIYHFSMIKPMVNEETGYTCYSGYFYSPLEYCSLVMYVWFADWDIYTDIKNYSNYFIMFCTIAIDHKKSSTRQRVDIRLSFMLCVTHGITIVFFIGMYLSNSTLEMVYPLEVFLMVDFYRYCMLIIICVVEMKFNTPKVMNKRVSVMSVSSLQMS